MSFLRRSGTCRQAASAALLLGCALTACSYGLRGGGFPEHVDTVFIEPFENRTPNFELEQELFRALLERYPSSLGIRTASRENADALLSGTIVSYNDVASNISPGGTAGRAEVLTHEVRVSVNAQLVDAVNNIVLWEGQVSGRGVYEPDNQTERVARDAALQMLVQELIDGALSQW